MAKLNFSIALGLASQNFKQGLQGVQSQLKGFANSVKSCMGMIAGAFAAGQIKAFSQECLQAYSAQMQAEQKLSVVMKQRMNVTDAEVKSILNLTSAQQKLGVIGDEVQLAGAQQVATFLKQKDSLNALIPAMNNLLAQQKGLNATQGDAVNIGNLMGKVMTGQTSALKRVGISFDAAQEKILKYGTESQKAATLAQVITDNVGQMNSALAQTDMGKIQQMNNILGDLKEQIGGAIAPIVAELAPTVTNVATTMANGLSNAINTIKANIKELVGFIAMQFAGIGIAKFIASAVAKFKAMGTQLEATAEATAVKRQAIESQIQNKISRLRVLEAEKAEATGAKLVKIEQSITTQRAALKDLLKKRNAAAEAQIVATNQAAAWKSASVWKKSMIMCKTATLSFVNSVKAAFRSFAPLLVFEMLFTVGMKVYDMLMKNSGGFRALASIVGGACLKAINALASALGWVLDNLAKILRVKAPAGGSGGSGSGSGKGKVYKAKDGTTYNSKKEALQHNYDLLHPDEKRRRDAKLAAQNGGGATFTAPKSTGGGHTVSAAGLGTSTKTSTTATTETPAQKAAKDVTEAEKKYKKSIDLAQINYDQSADKEAALVKCKQSQLSALESLRNVYADAYEVTGNKGYLARMQELQKQIEDTTTELEAVNEVEAATKKAEEDKAKAVEDRVKAEKDYAKSLKDIAKDYEGGRDTTFDYKKTDNEKVIADLEFDKSRAEAELEALRKKAEALGKESIEGLAEAEANVEGLDKKLAITKVKQDIEDLQSQLNSLNFEAVKSSWDGIKNTVNDINSLVETLEDPDTSGWEKFSAVIDEVMNLISTFSGILNTFNEIQEISTALTKANTVAKGANTIATETGTVATITDTAVTETCTAVSEVDTAATTTDTAVTATDTGTTIASTAATVADTAATEANAIAKSTLIGADTVAATTSGLLTGFTIAESAATGVNTGTTIANAAAHKVLGAALEVEAAAAIFAAHASIPFTGPEIAAGLVGMMEGVMTGVKTAALFLSEGGIVKGSTPNGDFVPAMLNSGEMVINKAQQSRLLNIANGASVSGSGSGTATSVVRGEQLVSVINAYGKRTGRGEILK